MDKMNSISLSMARTEAGFTQQEVARLINVDRATISHWEKGKTSPKLRQFKELCEIYQMEIDDIFVPETLLKGEKI